LSLVADQVALAISQALSRETSRRSQSELEVQNARLKLLGDLSNGGFANLPVNELLGEVTVGIRRVIPSDLAMVGLLDSKNDRVSVSASDMAEDNNLAKEAIDVLGEMFGARIFSTGKPWVGNSAEMNHVDAEGDPKWSVAGSGTVVSSRLRGDTARWGFSHSESTKALLIH
jgi:transcriptional regulator with GAF, ATPase, and Fis domain